LSPSYIKSFFSRTAKSKFIRNIAIVASGTAAAQAIAMAFAPFITRIYGPEAFGLLGVFMALTAILTPVAALTYPIAIVLPKEDTDAKGLAKLSFFVALIMAALTAVALLVGGEKLLSLIDSESIAPYVMLIPLSMLFAACMQIAQQWLIRKKQFGITARVAVIQALFVNCAKAAFGWFNPVGAVLVVLATVGQAVHAALLWMGVCKSKSLPERDSGVEVSLKELAKRHLDFPKYRAPQALLNPLSHSLPVLFLASFFGPAAAGFYTLARSVMVVPSVLISTSVGNVLYPRMAESANNSEKISPVIIKATLTLALIGIVPFGLLIAFGPLLFELVFGAEWVTAGDYAQWLTLWLFVGFINVPSNNALPILSLLPFFLVYEILSILLRLVALVLGFYVFSNDTLAIALFSVSGMILNLALIFVAITKARHIDNLTMQSS